MHVFFAMETPLRGRSGGHIGTTPTISFGWIVRGTVGGFEQIARGCSPLQFRLGGLRAQTVDAVLGIAHRRLISFGKIVRKWLFCLCGMRGKI